MGKRKGLDRKLNNYIMNANFTEAFNLVQKAEKYISNESKIQRTGIMGY